jgi:hypothetical protein
MFKPLVVSERDVVQDQPKIAESDVKRVFMVLHGYYGNLFFTKFATGVVIEAGDEAGQDQGVVNARRIWAHGLRPFDAETIKAALRLCQAKHPEFPPSLPQFAALCEANRPRATFRPENLIGMSSELRSGYARSAREINAKHAERKRMVQTGARRLTAGLDGLKQAIAAAVGEAGGDEAGELLRLDRLFDRKVVA